MVQNILADLFFGFGVPLVHSGITHHLFKVIPTQFFVCVTVDGEDAVVRPIDIFFFLDGSDKA
jgi:hypothetical protein